MGAAFVLVTRWARGTEPIRPPLPESLLTESATDIDAEDAGETEYEANVVMLRARRGGASAALASLEFEWRVLRELGLRLEPSYARLTDVQGAASTPRLGMSGAVAIGLLHDFEHDFHLQAELLGRISERADETSVDPGEAELPASADLVAARRVGRLTFRTAVGGEAGGAFAYAPLHTDLAVLTGLTAEERYGFLAIDLRADWARSAPFVLAPELVGETTPIGLPFRLGVAFPVNLGVHATQPAFGIFMRLAILTQREAESGRR
jgi:hypothetical protein